MKEGSIEVEIAFERVQVAAYDLAVTAYAAAEWYNGWRQRNGLPPLGMPAKPDGYNAIATAKG